MESFDQDEIRHQSDNILALINDLRPYRDAKLISREKYRLIAILSRNEIMLKQAEYFDEHSLIWELDGEYMHQRVSLGELIWQ